MYSVITEWRTLSNFSGSFILAWMFRTTPFPSKSNTATPKNSGIYDIDK